MEALRQRAVKANVSPSVEFLGEIGHSDFMRAMNAFASANPTALAVRRCLGEQGFQLRHFGLNKVLLTHTL